MRACRHDRLLAKGVGQTAIDALALCAATDWEHTRAVQELIQRFFADPQAVRDPTAWLHRAVQRLQ